MKESLERLAREYVSKVDEVCKMMLIGLRVTSKAELCRLKTKAQQGNFMLQGENYYFFHGVGCKFKNKEVEIDWEFGPDDIWCVIDPWKLFSYAKSTKQNANFTVEQIKMEFENAVKEGMMFKEHFGYRFKAD